MKKIKEKFSTKQIVLLGAVAVVIIAALIFLGVRLLSPQQTTTTGPEPTSEPLVVEDTPPGEDEQDARLGLIDRQYLINTDEVEIIAARVNNDELWGMGLQMEMTNKGSEEITIATTYLTACGIMANTPFTANIPAGATITDTAYVDSDILAASGLTYITEFEIGLEVKETASGAVLCATESPIYIRTSLKSGSTQSVDMTKVRKLYDENNIRAFAKKTKEDSFALGDGLWVYIENLSSESVKLDQASINVEGKGDSSAFKDTTVAPHRAAILFIPVPSELQRASREWSAMLSFRIVNANTFPIIDAPELEIQ